MTRISPFAWQPPAIELVIKNQYKITCRELPGAPGSSRQLPAIELVNKNQYKINCGELLGATGSSQELPAIEIVI